MTGEGRIKCGKPGTCPGASLNAVLTGQVIEKVDDADMPTGTFYDTTGMHELLGICVTDQDRLNDAVAVLDALPADADLAKVKVSRGAGLTVDATGQGLYVADVSSMRVAVRATLTLQGGASDVIVIRNVIAGARGIKFGHGAKVVLTGGLLPEHVLYYSRGKRCRVGGGAEGFGTFFCPDAKKIGVGGLAKWTGTFLGSRKDIRAGRGAKLTHKEFSGL